MTPMILILFCLFVFVGKFKEKAETLNSVARRKSDAKDKSEGSTEGCEHHSLTRD